MPYDILVEQQAIEEINDSSRFGPEVPGGLRCLIQKLRESADGDLVSKCKDLQWYIRMTKAYLAGGKCPKEYHAECSNLLPEFEEQQNAVKDYFPSLIFIKNFKVGSSRQRYQVRLYFRDGVSHERQNSLFMVRI